MFEKRITIGERDLLTLVEMGGGLSIDTWDESDILVRLPDGEEQDLTVEETDAGPAVSAGVVCKVWVPTRLAVKVRQVRANMRVQGVSKLDAEQVRGSLRLKDVVEASIAEVYGNLKANQMSSLYVRGTVFGEAGVRAVDTVDLQNVRGNLVAKGITHLRASRIGGNLNAKDIAAALAVDQVGGNALLRGVAGAVTLEQVAGNLGGKSLTGGAKVPKIGGNLVLNGEIGAGCTYHFSARGNATLRLSEGANAHLTLMAKRQILSSMTLADQTQEAGRLSGTLGNGGAEVVVEAQGNVMLGGGGPGIGIELGEEISRQVEESLQAIDLEAIGQQVSEEMESAMARLQVKLESVDWERIGVEAQSGVERAMAQLRRNMDRMVTKATHHQEKLERKLEREARRQERVKHRRQRAETRRHEVEVEVEGQNQSPNESYTPPAPEPDLDEDRLSVLRMVEQGQITPEEAEMLLDAL